MTHSTRTASHVSGTGQGNFGGLYFRRKFCWNRLGWNRSGTGRISVKAASAFYRHKNTQQMWKEKLWNNFVPPKISLFAWKVCHNRVLTGDVLYKRGIIPAACCVGCIVGKEETANHLLLECSIALNVWTYMSTVLSMDLLTFQDTVSKIKWAAQAFLHTTCTLVYLELQKWSNFGAPFWRGLEIP